MELGLSDSVVSKPRAEGIEQVRIIWACCRGFNMPSSLLRLGFPRVKTHLMNASAP